jgi:regulator of replication initiation timing
MNKDDIIKYLTEENEKLKLENEKLKESLESKIKLLNE